MQLKVANNPGYSFPGREHCKKESTNDKQTLSHERYGDFAVPFAYRCVPYLEH